MSRTPWAWVRSCASQLRWALTPPIPAYSASNRSRPRRGSSRCRHVPRGLRSHHRYGDPERACEPGYQPPVTAGRPAREVEVPSAVEPGEISRTRVGRRSRRRPQQAPDRYEKYRDARHLRSPMYANRWRIYASSSRRHEPPGLLLCLLLTVLLVAMFVSSLGVQVQAVGVPYRV